MPMSDETFNIVRQNQSGASRNLAWKFTLGLAAASFLVSGLQFSLQQPPDPSRGLFDKSLTAEQIAAAVENLTPEERQKIRTKETDQLVLEPLDRTALRNITLLTVLEKGPKAEELAIASAKRSFRDPQNQLMAVQSLLKNEKFEESLSRLDGLLRAKPYLANGIFPTILTIAKNPKATMAITTLLKTDPPWRRLFLQFALGSPGGFQLVYQILGQLRSAGEVLHVEDLRAVLKSAIGAKEFDVAYFIWLDFLVEAELKRVAPIYDGGFDLPTRDLYFDWTLQPQKNLKLAIDKRPGNTNDGALKIDFFGYSGNFAQVSQILRLTPGTYASSFETSGQNFVSEGGLQLHIGCLETGILIGRSDAVRQNKAWTTMQFGFSVPTEKCDTQLLRLVSASKAKLDNQMSGQIYFDNFSIELTAAQ